MATELGERLGDGSLYRQHLRGPKKAEDITRNAITLILSETPLNIIIEDISEDEKKNLLYDMELLGLFEKPE